MFLLFQTSGKVYSKVMTKVDIDDTYIHTHIHVYVYNKFLWELFGTTISGQNHYFEFSKLSDLLVM